MDPAPETEPLPHRTPPLVRLLLPAGQLSASSTRSSGRCTSSSRRPCWRSMNTALTFPSTRVFDSRWRASPCAQVQRGVQVPAQRAARAAAAAALLGSADAEEAPEVQSDRFCEVETPHPHGLPDWQPAALLTGTRAASVFMPLRELCPCHRHVSVPVVSLWSSVFRWMFWSLSFLSCFSRSTPPETLRASDWHTTISSATCWPSPSSCWSRYVAEGFTCQQASSSHTDKLWSSGVPLSERDPGAVRYLLFSGQSDRGCSGRERSRSARPAGQGTTCCLLVLHIWCSNVWRCLTFNRNFRVSDDSRPYCSKSFRVWPTTRSNLNWLSFYYDWITTSTTHRQEARWAGRTHNNTPTSTTHRQEAHWAGRTHNNTPTSTTHRQEARWAGRTHNNTPTSTTHRQEARWAGRTHTNKYYTQAGGTLGR